MVEDNAVIKLSSANGRRNQERIHAYDVLRGREGTPWMFPKNTTGTPYALLKAIEDKNGGNPDACRENARARAASASINLAIGVSQHLVKGCAHVRLNVGVQAQRSCF